MSLEDRIVYENGVFYAWKVDANHYEIRRNVSTYSVSLGVVPSVDRAIRFIDRAVKYPKNF